MDRARLTRVDVAVDERIRIGAQQREHGLFGAVAPARVEVARDPAEGVAALHGYRSAGVGRARDNRRWRGRRDRRAGRDRIRRARLRRGRRLGVSATGVGAAAGSGARSTVSEGAGTGIRSGSGAGAATLCGASTSAEYSRTSRPEPQSTSSRKVSAGCCTGCCVVTRITGGRRHPGRTRNRGRRPALGGARPTGRRSGRGQLRLQALQFVRIAADDRDFRDQRLPRLRLHHDLPSPSANAGSDAQQAARPRTAAAIDGGRNGNAHGIP